MRIWDAIPCSRLCRAHLLGEHRELHAIYAVIARGLAGYRNHPEVRRYRGHIDALLARHAEQAEEMLVRGWAHRSPLPRPRDNPPLPTPLAGYALQVLLLRAKASQGRCRGGRCLHQIRA
ncbi:MAG: pyrimidine dimer DNA glycosylase/endonuclease V [Gemmatimonadota bacterium]